MYKDQHIELKKALSAVLKKWWLIILLMVVFALGSGIVCTLFVDKVYQAQTTMFIGKEKGSLGKIGLSFADIEANNQLIVDYKEIANSRLVILATVNNLHIKMDPEDFRKRMSINIVENSRLFTVSFSSTDPVLAAKIANELAKQLTIAASEIVSVENIRIIDTALVPNKPVSPDVNLITLLSGVIGLLLGLFIIYLVDIFDETFSSQESIENQLGLTAVAIIPKFRGSAKRNTNSTSVMMSDHPSNLSESYRICRTNINFMNVDKNYQVLMLTSSIPSEGKTTTSCNLAIAMAQANKRVLLIDGDLRKSSVYKLFNIPPMPGLTDAMFSKRSLSNIVTQVDRVPGLDILVAGRTSPNPAELLGSDSFKSLLDEARDLYDTIIFDAPPVLSVADTAIISQLADGVLFLVAMKETHRSLALEAKKALEKVSANIVGTIITKALSNKHDYYYYENKH